MTDQTPTGHTLTDAERDAIATVLHRAHNGEGDECPDCFAAACSLQESSEVESILAARGGNTDNTLRAAIDEVVRTRTFKPTGFDYEVTYTADLRAALDAAPAPTECPSTCGRNEPCTDRWHDDQRRAAPAPTDNQHPCNACEGRARLGCSECL